MTCKTVCIGKMTRRGQERGRKEKRRSIKSVVAMEMWREVLCVCHCSVSICEIDEDLEQV